MASGSEVKVGDLWRHQTAKIKGKYAGNLGMISLTDCQAVEFGNPIPVLSVSAEQLIKEYKNDDEEAFNKKYEGKLLKIVGVVAKINKEDAEQPMRIEIKGNESPANPPLVTFRYIRRQESQVKMLKDGGPITVKGECQGKSSFTKDIELTPVEILTR